VPGQLPIAELRFPQGLVHLPEHCRFSLSGALGRFDRAAGESAAEITQNALTGACAACVETLEFWTDAFGAESGNLALRVLAYGGVYLAGGIAVKILPLLRKSSFCTAFADKGPLSPILQNIPIAVVLNEDAPILGAAYAALGATN